MNEYHVVFSYGPTPCHDSLEKAREAAEEYATSHPGVPVAILKTVGTCLANSVQWDWKDEAKP